MPLLKTMLKNPRVIGVKNSSIPLQDIQMFKDECGEGHVVFNGPDEQLAGGIALGADGGIGGTYGVMPELYLAIYKAAMEGDRKTALDLQYKADRIIYALCSFHGNMYGVIKEVIRIREGLKLGSVRAPLAPVIPEDMAQIQKCVEMINSVI